MKKISDEDVKNIEIEMLDYLNKVCLENNIKMFLGGGTLLGAVRHSGFIPWDDDIDVMLLRDDYSKLLDILKKKEDSFKLINYDNCCGYYYPFAKLVNSNTILYENDLKYIDGIGIYIDIFPIDNLPNSKLKIEYIFFKRKIYQSFINLLSNKNYISNSSGFKRFVKSILYHLFKRVNPNKVAAKYDNLLLKYKDIVTDNVVCITGSYIRKEIMPKDYISDSIEVEFEGNNYLAPIGYKDYLTKHYGDYMKLPPEEKRVSNHNNDCYWKDIDSEEK